MIILFSGTGNSLLVARELQRYLGGEIETVEGERLVNPSGAMIEIPSGEPVVWVMPVYSWSIPPVMETFIRKVRMKGAHEVPHFLVVTCGDDIGFADNRWRKLIGRRGWNPRGSFSVTMPNTYVCMKGFDVDSPEVAARKLDAMPGRVEAIVAAINRGFSESDVNRGSWAWLKTAVVYPWFRAFAMSTKPFTSTSACISCGLCSRSCPMENITMHNGRPQWGSRCALCLRCYHICPSHAVAYGHETASKGQKQILK